MAYDPGAIDAALAAALGDDPALIAELRFAFTESASQAMGALEAATTADRWVAGARRLKGLAASFGAIRLMAMASAAEAKPLDPEMLKRLQRAVARL